MRMADMATNFCMMIQDLDGGNGSQIASASTFYKNQIPIKQDRDQLTRFQ